MPAARPLTSIVETFELLPGQIRPIDIPGDFFLVVETSGEIEVARTGAAFNPYSQGDGEILAPGQEFNRLEIRNPNLSAVRVTIFAGYGRRVQNRQSVIEPKTTTRAIHAGNIAAGATVNLAQPLQAGEIRRKSVIVTNGSAELRLQILDAAGNLADIVQPGHSKLYTVSEGFGLKNDNGTAVEAFALGIFWAA